MKKEQIVLVEQRDRNGKIHYIAVENMELAKNSMVQQLNDN